MKLQEISWPVFKLKEYRPEEEDGILFYPDLNGEKRIVDDRNLPQDSLVGRRLSLLVKGVKIYNPKFSIFFLGDLIKIAKPTTWFIDSNGKIFQYKKTQFAKLVFRKITNIIRSVGCTLIEAENSPARFKCLFPPKLEEKYLGVLKMGKEEILYGFFKEKYTPTRRKV